MDKAEILIKKSQIDDFLKDLPEVGPFGEELISNSRKSIIVNRTVTSDGPAKKSELHENYVDVFLVSKGEEDFFVGGKITDKEEVSEGEWRGSGLEGAVKYRIAEGDIIIIPKGVAHQHGEGTVKMIVLKIQ